MKSWLDDELQTIRDSGLYKDEKIIRTPQGPDVDTSQGEMINFCANNYLGLADNPEIERAVADGLAKHGFGMASVRFICGTQDIHKTLEQELTDWFGTEDTILYTSCFDANTGLFETLLGPEDAIISDALNHASIIDGVRLCRAQRKVFKHTDMADLEEKLKETESARFRMIATDGVFSMQGDIAPLSEICDLADRYDALVMVDDSHATGFMGPNGLGSPDEMGVLDRIDVLTSTMGKGPGGRVRRLHDRQGGDRGVPAATVPPLSLLEHPGAAHRHRRTEGPGDRQGQPRPPGDPVGEHPVLPVGDVQRWVSTSSRASTR